MSCFSFLYFVPVILSLYIAFSPCCHDPMPSVSIHHRLWLQWLERAISQCSVGSIGCALSIESLSFSFVLPPRKSRPRWEDWSLVGDGGGSVSLLFPCMASEEHTSLVDRYSVSFLVQLPKKLVGPRLSSVCPIPAVLLFALLCPQSSPSACHLFSVASRYVSHRPPSFPRSMSFRSDGKNCSEAKDDD